MKCKRCGCELPSRGFLCSNCGMMMDSDQIKEQKELMKNDSGMKDLLLSEKYGNKKQIFQKRVDGENKIVGFVVILSVILLIILIALFVYFY